QNLTDDLKSRGLTTVSGLVKLWDVNPAVGGRLVRDKVWFFGSYRNSAVTQTRAGIFENLTPRGWTYTPDLTRPAVSKIADNSENMRLTWQVTPRNKISVFGDDQLHYLYHRNYQFNVSPEATTDTPYIPNSVYQLVW